MRGWKQRSFAAAFGIAAALSLTPSDEARAEPTVQCTVAARAICRVTEPNGIKRVVVERRTSRGPSEALDKTYACVSEVFVAWTPAESAAELKVTPCRDPNLRTHPSFGRLEGTPFLNRRFELSFLDTNADGRPDAVDAHYAPFAQMGFTLHPTTSKLEDLSCTEISVCESMADYCDRNNGVGSCYEDHCVCDLP